MGQGLGQIYLLPRTATLHSLTNELLWKGEACLITRKIYDKITMSADEHNKMVNIMFHILSGPVVNLYLGHFSSGPGACSWIIWMSGFISSFVLPMKQKITQYSHKPYWSSWIWLAPSFTDLTLSHVQIWSRGNDILHDSLWTGKSLRAYHGNQLARACYRTQATVQRLESDILTLLSMDEKSNNQTENRCR